MQVSHVFYQMITVFDNKSTLAEYFVVLAILLWECYILLYSFHMYRSHHKILNIFLIYCQEDYT